MRTRIYVWSEEAKRLVPAWKDEGPSYARAAGTRGELVVGVSERQMERMKNRAARERNAA